jgi:hypothetical protein
MNSDTVATIASIIILYQFPKIVLQLVGVPLVN